MDSPVAQKPGIPLTKGIATAEVGIAFGAAVTRAVSDVLGTLSFARGSALGD